MVKFTGKPVKPRDSRDVYAFLLILIVGLAGLFVLFEMHLISSLVLLVGLIILLFIIYTKSPPFIIEVKEYERAIVFRMGKALEKIYDPGWHFLIPFIDEPIIVDMRTRTIDVPRQKVVTKDEIEVTIDAIIYYRVVDIKKAVLGVRDYSEAAVSVTYAHLRDIVGKMTLNELLSNVDKVNKLLKKEISEIAKEWGIEVDHVEIKEVRIPDEVLEAMHKKKAAEELKKAAEQEALAEAIKIDAVREAAGKLNEPALQFLYLEALKKVAEGRSSKILFPVELSKMAEKIAGVTGKDHKSVEKDLRKQFEEFVKKEEEKARKELEEFSKSSKHVKEFLKKKPKSPRKSRKR